MSMRSRRTRPARRGTPARTFRPAPRSRQRVRRLLQRRNGRKNAGDGQLPRRIRHGPGPGSASRGCEPLRSIPRTRSSRLISAPPGRETWFTKRILTLRLLMSVCARWVDAAARDWPRRHARSFLPPRPGCTTTGRCSAGSPTPQPPQPAIVRRDQRPAKEGLERLLDQVQQRPERRAAVVYPLNAAGV